MIHTTLTYAGPQRLVAALLVALLTLAGVSAISAVGPSDTITTVAGIGTTGYSGDGGPATAAQLFGPGAVAADTSGNLFIADSVNNVIRKVDAAGIITTVVGNGSSGYSGDGGPATAAQLNFPRGVALDAAGNLFIADQGNNRVRRVTVNPALSQIEQLLGEVEALADSGTLNGGQSNALIGKLDQAATQLAQQDTQQAINKLHAFINQVTSFIDTGVLTAAEGQPLIDAANAIIQALGG